MEQTDHSASQIILQKYNFFYDAALEYTYLIISMKIHKPIIIALILLLTVSQTIAQRRSDRQIIRAYPLIGATASQIRGDELRGFNKWGITAGVGSEVTISSNNLWKLSLEAVFSQRGAYNNTNDPYSLIQFTMNYVDIPLTLHFTDPYGGITIGVGLSYSRLVQQPHGMMFYNAGYFIPDTSDMTFLRNDFSAALDLRFPIWRGLTFNLRFQHSIIPVKRDWMFTEHYSAAEGDEHSWTNDCYNSSVSIRLLYVFGEQPKYKKSHKKSSNKRRR